MNSGNNSTTGYGVAPAKKQATAGPAQGLADTQFTPKHIGYGLPCAKCKTYYAADLSSCPICNSPQRVSPIEPVAKLVSAEQMPDPQQLEAERERFLEELNSKVIASPVPSDVSASGTHCAHVENHGETSAPATICQECYENLQERVDVFEAAMHMDITEAAQVIYDAVWADPSDPSKTYQNAAQALLTELRRRSGVPQVFGPLQPPVN